MSEVLHELGEKLSAAIQDGDAKEASNLVLQLSAMRLKLDISIKKEEMEQRNKEHEFRYVKFFCNYRLCGTFR